MPLAEKTTWRQWLAKHPHTQILTVNGKAHIESNPYENYMTSEKTFRPVENPDERLSQKAPVFTFTLENEPFAIAHQQAEGGWSGQAGDTSLFIYRAKGDAVYRSTLAFLLGPGAKLKKKRGRWHSSQYGAFNPKTGAFDGSAQPEPLHGVDSYWYIWTKYYPRTALLD